MNTLNLSGGTNRREFLRYGAIAVATILGCRKNVEDTISPNNIENNRENINTLLVNSYEKGEMSLDKAIQTINSLYTDIAKMIHFEPKDKNNIQEELIEHFLAQGYVLAISPMRLQSGKFCINAPCYKIELHENFDLSKLQFDRFPGCNELISVFKVTHIIVPDIRETNSLSDDKRLIIDGLTLLGNEASKDIVLIFPNSIKFMAKKEGMDEAAYMNTVIVNEVSQKYFHLLLNEHSLDEMIPPIRGVDTSNLTLYHALEAFSDLASLKYGIFGYEIIRIINSTSDEYSFSRKIAKACVNRRLATLKINPQNTEQDIKRIMENNEADFKAYVLNAYEIVLSYIYESVINQIKM